MTSSPVDPGSVDRREALPGAEQASLHENPQRLPGLVIEVHLGDLADPVALGVDSDVAEVLLLSVLRAGHGCLPFLPDAAPADVRATRRGTRHAELPCEDSHKQLWPICALRACHVRCSPGSRSALASGSQVAAGGNRWQLMA